ncbi:ABC transporter permease [Desulfosporosinus youngiae]|uniref:ABC-type nitrate/sulfonate/bicarbonate transport system, permease component n=1 Tax=Desulfosporosinus youngiae DSM 17734 TaxID=768710 RepID=H5Y4P4_9FIRM|nr:ABC transporter permease subunit [Desulfosporosinus youngiae]EHQ89780.1 ABC-type nitrate/sulfonate/bicarbonate transport system, permease component [Desulfosporosinus youngiae DSM 17734]
MKASIWPSKLYTLVAVLSLVILWALAAVVVGAEILLPSPWTVLKDLVQLLPSRDFLQAVLHTVSRCLAGFSIAFLAALLLGIPAGLWPPLHYLLNPLVITIKSTPSMSIILLALIWLDTERATILIGLLVIFPILYANITTGIQNVDSKLVEMSKIYHVKKSRMVRELYLPSMLPHLVSASSTALGLNLKVIITAEVFSQPKISMGTSLQLEKVYLNTAGVFAWTLAAILISAIFDYALGHIKKRIEKGT